jgi:YidC/Oxa1 family membrane protein insertase
MENLRIPLLIAFGACLFLMYQSWQEDYAPVVQAIEAPIGGGESFGDVPGLSESDIPQSVSQSSDAEGSVPAAVGSDPMLVTEVVRNAKVITVSTDLYNAEISTIGGNILKLELVDYPMDMYKPEGQKRRLLNDGNQYHFIAQTGLTSKTNTVPTHESVFTASSDSFRMSGDQLDVPLTWADGSGLTVTKTISFTRGSYEIGVSQSISNSGDGNAKISPYAQFVRNEFSSTAPSGPFMNAFNGAAFYKQDDDEKYKYRKSTFEDLTEEKIAFSQKGGWVAMVQHYFLGAIIPSAEVRHHFYGKARKGDRYVAGFVSDSLVVEPGRSAESNVRLFLGPKLQDVIADVSPGLELTTDYGFLSAISKPMYWLLSFINSFVNNWGFSILLVTLLIKGAFFKLSEAQYKSMAKMRRFTPRIQQLRERHSDDRAVLNQKMMELYKTEKFNPLGGCLPMIVQVPFFIGLYWVLMESVELHQAPFILWISDLSVKDPYYILPLVLGAVMFAQSKMQAATITDPIQKKVMTFMPLMMCVFFAFFPAGLVLYWFANTSLGILQQWYINRKMDQQAA